jgi:hypothetical protein
MPSPSSRNSKSDLLLRAMSWLGFGAGLYLLPAIAVILDEEILDTNWISNQMPPELGRIFCKLYPWVCTMYGG